MLNRTSENSREKLLAAVFLLLGITTFVFGYFSISKAITSPFSGERDFHVKTAEEQEQERVAGLKETDTDKDSVNDYDELYVFRTSPFLADSDSDGLADGDEIASGSDPNCPKGKTCRSATVSSDVPAQSAFVSGEFDERAAAAAAATGQASGVSPDASVPAGDEIDVNQVITDTFGDVSELSADEFKAKVEAMSIPDVRAFMMKLGVSSETLQKTDDATLRQVVGEALTEAMKSYSAPATTPAPASASSNP